MAEQNVVPAIQYDPTLLYHHMAFKCRCAEARSTEFERFFEEIMVRVQPGFKRTRPHGKLGDRKTDGLYLADGTVYQVYAPDEIRLPALTHKVNEDLDGAVEYWSSDLRKWFFVCNAPQGLPTDVYKVLAEKQGQYPEIEVACLTNDQLWDMVRDLPIQLRTEILGIAPAGHANAFVTPARGDNFNDIENPWILMAHDPISPISIRSATEALLPEKPFGAPFYIRPADYLDWTTAAEYQRQKWEELREITWDLSPQYALYTIAPIPLAIHLGFVVSDRVDLTCFHYHRDKRTWSWPAQGIPKGLELHLRDNVPEPIDAATDIVLCISLSASVLLTQLSGVVDPQFPRFEITTENPDVRWLQSPNQLSDLGDKFLDAVQRIRSAVPNYRRIHLFYAGPSAGAVVIGQRINPRMMEPVDLYQYSRQSVPQYERVLTLADTGTY